MKKFAPLVAAFLIGLAATGCASITLAPAGGYAAGSAGYTLGQNWSDLTAVMPNRGPGIHILTIDGPLLNRLILTDGIEDGAPILRPANREQRMPVHRAGASASEQVEFVVDTLAVMDYQSIEASGLRRAARAGGTGVLFDLTARTPEGLNVSGLAQVIEVDGRLYVAIFAAPTEHYFGVYQAEALRVMESFRL